MYSREVMYKNEKFINLANRFYDGMLQKDPIHASFIGEHSYDDLLPEIGVEAIEKENSFYREIKTAFESLNENELTDDEKLDRELAIHICELGLFWNEDVKRWKAGVDVGSLIGDSIFSIFIRDYIPINKRLESIINRLKLVPAFLMASKSLFQDVPYLWGEFFIESCYRIISYINKIKSELRNKALVALLQEFDKAANKAEEAIKQFKHWFENAIMPKAKGDWAMGKHVFEELIKHKKLGMSIPELLELGDSVLKQNQEKLDQIAYKIIGTRSLDKVEMRKEAINKIKSKKPKTFQQAIDAYKDAIARSKAFVQLTNFASIPQNESLEIIETPEYMAHFIPFAAYISPAKHSKDQKGLYLITRPANNDISRHNYLDIMNTSVHEAYPGHHLQMVWANLNPSRIRTFTNSVELCEGWALYCEEAIINKGFEATDESIFVQIYDECWRAARILIDINMHSKTWNYDKSLKFLLENTPFDLNSAKSEINRYTFTPGYQLSYLTGKYLIKRLKSTLQRIFSPQLTDTDFHDIILKEGSIPLYFASKYYPKFLAQVYKHK